MTLLSLCKCSPFALQKESLWNAKGVLLKNNRRRVTIVLHKFQPFCLALISACNTIVTHSTRIENKLYVILPA